MRRTALVLLILALLATPVLADHVTGSIVLDLDQLAGADSENRLFLYTPDPVRQGSSMSHWDPSATPSLLMEPSITPDLDFNDLDITPAQMMDIGWQPGTSTLNIINLDPPGVGFTDPRPFAGAPGNGAATLGEARVNLVNSVLGAWGGTLESDVPIDVLVTWTELPCTAGQGAVLAAAGATFVFFDAPGAIVPGVWYHAALAEALAGEDLTGPPAEGGGDVIVLFNTEIDNECLGDGTGYYYGLDGNNPPNQIDLAPTALHEIGHGLGFSNFANETTGQLLQDRPGIYSLFSLDTTQGRTWAEMTDAERQMSAVNTYGVVWNGDEVTDMADDFLQPGAPTLTVNGVPGLGEPIPIGLAAFGPPVTDTAVTAPIACLVDGISDPSPLNGCTDAINPGELDGRIALVDRGACSFVDKVRNAQEAGAVAVIISNNAGNSPPGIGGVDDGTITIPAVSVGRSDGTAIRAAVCGDTAGTAQGGRFQITATWADGEGNGGVAEAMELTDDAAYFHFGNPDNVELVVKVLNGCKVDGFDDSYWVFAAGLTNLEVMLTVTDTANGSVWAYENDLGAPFPPIQDTSAFATCP